jgi:hypothetical protein
MLETLFAVDENLIGATAQLTALDHAVNNRKRAVLDFDMRVMTRGARVVEHDAVVRRAANGTGSLRR